MLTLGRYTLYCTNDFKTFQQFKYLIGELMNALMFFYGLLTTLNSSIFVFLMLLNIRNLFTTVPHSSRS